MRPITPPSLLEQAFNYVASAIGSEEVLVFALLVLFVVVIVFAVTLFAEVFCCRSGR